MFYHVIVEPEENSPPTLECAAIGCMCQFPFEHSHTFAWYVPNQGMVHAGFCSYRCALHAMNPQCMWRA